MKTARSQFEPMTFGFPYLPEGNADALLIRSRLVRSRLEDNAGLYNEELSLSVAATYSLLRVVFVKVVAGRTGD